jgi:hypothetical protein
MEGSGRDQFEYYPRIRLELRKIIGGLAQIRNGLFPTQVRSVNP